MKGVDESRNTEETRWKEEDEGGRMTQALEVMVDPLLVLHDHLKPLQNLMHLSRQNARHGPPKARLQLLHALLQQLQIRQFLRNLVDPRHRLRLIINDLGDGRMMWRGTRRRS